MPLPTPTRSWTYQHKGITRGSTAIQQCTNVIREIKKTFLDFGWTVWGSAFNAGGGYGNGDGVDRWPAFANLTWSTDWIVLVHSTICGGVKVLLGLTQGSLSCADNLIVRYSKLGFGAANGGTDGTTSIVPTALDQVTLNTGVWGANETVYRPHYLHTMMSTDGLCYRMFLFQSNLCTGFWFFDVASATDPAWIDINIFRMLGTKSPWDVTTLSSTGIGDLYAFKTKIAGTLVALCPIGPAIFVNPTSAILGSNTIQKIENNNTDGYPFHEIGLHCNTAPYRGIKGKLVDIWWGQRRLNGDCFPNDRTQQFTQLGGVVVPWDGTEPITCPMNSPAW